MMRTAEEFVSLRRSARQQDYLRAATDSASTEVCLEVITRFPDMRVWVAHNKTVPIEVLSILARHADPDIRMAVALKNKLSEDLFSLLAADPNDSVRERIACNKKTPTEALRRLANDTCDLVSIQATERVRKREAQ